MAEQGLQGAGLHEEGHRRREQQRVQADRVGQGSRQGRRALGCPEVKVKAMKGHLRPISVVALPLREARSCSLMSCTKKSKIWLDLRRLPSVRVPTDSAKPWQTDFYA